MNNSRFGFKHGDLETILNAVIQFPEIEKAAIFGSRAKGNYQPGSDIDLVLWTSSTNDTWQLPGILNDETPLPYKFDVLDYGQINSEELKNHIDRAAVEIYRLKPGVPV